MMDVDGVWFDSIFAFWFFAFLDSCDVAPKRICTGI
jgi:hypothetical protein